MTAKTKKTSKPKTEKFPEPATVLVLRTVAADGVSRGSNHADFVWPALGPVECPDWNPESKCGHGLHGMIWGEGDWSLLSSADDARWQVVEVERSAIVDLKHEHQGKVKFPRGTVLYTGERAVAVAMVLCGKQTFEHDQAVASKKSSGREQRRRQQGREQRRRQQGREQRRRQHGREQRRRQHGREQRQLQHGRTKRLLWGCLCNRRRRASDGWRSGVACAIGDGVRVTAGDLGLLIATWWDADAKRYRAVVGYVGEGGIAAGVEYVVRAGKLEKA